MSEHLSCVVTTRRAGLGEDLLVCHELDARVGAALFGPGADVPARGLAPSLAHLLYSRAFVMVDASRGDGRSRVLELRDARAGGPLADCVAGMVRPGATRGAYEVTFDDGAGLLAGEHGWLLVAPTLRAATYLDTTDAERLAARLACEDPDSAAPIWALADALRAAEVDGGAWAQMLLSADAPIGRLG